MKGAVRAFNMPAGQAFLPLLVTAERFPNAVAWSSSVFQTTTIAGPIAGGILYAWIGNTIPVYASAAIAYLAGMLLISAVRPRVVERPRSAASLGVVLDGFRYIWRNKLVLGALSLDLFPGLLGGAVALLPVYARELLPARASRLAIPHT